MKLTNPHKFSERIMLFGGGGAGKTTAVLSIAEHLAHGRMWVIDNDYSYAYQRALATDFSTVDNVEVIEVDADWEECVNAIERVVAEADPTVDWLVIDPFSPMWNYVQTWMSTRVHGADIDEYMIDLRRDTDDRKEFHKSLNEAMNWPIVDRVWTEKVLKPLRRWRGHLILVCEATETGKFDDDESKGLFGHLGVKPAGQKRTHHIASTNLLLTKTSHGEYRMTTAKDRNRAEQERQAFDNFALDYLRDVAGWQRARPAGD
jgi:hypothetical protein